MTTYPQASPISELLAQHHKIVIVQADNPDGDSLGSALALEHILGDMGKEPYLYCGVEIPSYLTYMAGWDRVHKELPGKFDLVIIVDTSADSLLEALAKSGEKKWMLGRPIIVLDHHATEATITYATVMCNQKAVATGEVIYELAQQLNWQLNAEAKKCIGIAILSDSLGLTTEATTARSIHIMGELVEGGLSIAVLEEQRRELMRKAPDLVKYKGTLLQRVQYSEGNRIATVIIPWEEIEKYSSQYNPSMLVIEDMRMTIGTNIAIAFKTYPNGRVTAKIRANYGYPIAQNLAEHFGGGGHRYASGFKVEDGRPFNEIKSECIRYASELLDNLEREQNNETVQHPQS